MAIDRRELLIGAAAALMTVRTAPSLAAASEPARFASAFAGEASGYGVGLIGGDLGIARTIAMPARCHDIAVRPGSREAVVFARRPGRFAVRFDLDGRAGPLELGAEENRHFFGHGVYTADGRLMLSSENDIAGGAGVIGIRDATGGYRPIGSMPTGGTGPHDIALLSDGRTLIVANGGIETDPNGRTDIAVSQMRSSLTAIDLASGALIDRQELKPDWRLLSIRHLAVAAEDSVVFGCQWHGAMTEHPPLVGITRVGAAPRMLDCPAMVTRRMRGYVGSVAVDSSGTLASASSPKGGLVAHWDIASGRFLGTSELADVCGLTGTGRAREILLTSGAGVTRRTMPDGDAATISPPEAHADLHFDNHIVWLGGAT
ncbi:MAG: DUF1513 domain-containing protein [Hyphomicrobiaceae bacterium]